MMWQTQTTIEYPFALRPASIEEAGLFYSQMDEAEDAVLGTVGHIRMDFGASGKEFYHTWWPHNGDQFNTGEFKDELQKFVDMLRSDGPLTNLASMRNYCYQHGGKITEDGRCFGYIAETEHYRYCLRCTPSPGEYQGYLYSYDLRQQRMAQQAKPVGRITYAGGEEQTFTDKFLLSYNDDEFIRSLYDRPGIYLMETTRINNIKQRYDNGAQFPELIIANYDMHERLRVAPSQMNLFDLTGGDTAWLKS